MDTCRQKVVNRDIREHIALSVIYLGMPLVWRFAEAGPDILERRRPLHCYLY
jgi:hypothetical protein